MDLQKQPVLGGKVQVQREKKPNEDLQELAKEFGGAPGFRGESIRKVPTRHIRTHTRGAKVTVTKSETPDISADQQVQEVSPVQPAAPAQMPKPVLSPTYLLLDEGQSATFTCLTPGYADCVFQWKFLGGPLPHGWRQHDNHIILQSAQQIHAGDYICNVTDQFGTTTVSDPGTLEIRKALVPPERVPTKHIRTHIRRAKVIIDESFSESIIEYG